MNQENQIAILTNPIDKQQAFFKGEVVIKDDISPFINKVAEFLISNNLNKEDLYFYRQDAYSTLIQHLIELKFDEIKESLK